MIALSFVPVMVMGRTPNSLLTRTTLPLKSTQELIDYARANPDRINGELTPVIVYEPRAGHRAFRVMMEKLAEPPTPSP